MARENYIGGAWMPARTGATDPVVAPATGDTLEEVASSGAVDVDARGGGGGRRVPRVGGPHAA